MACAHLDLFPTKREDAFSGDSGSEEVLANHSKTQDARFQRRPIPNIASERLIHRQQKAIREAIVKLPANETSIMESLCAVSREELFPLGSI